MYLALLSGRFHGLDSPKCQKVVMEGQGSLGEKVFLLRSLQDEVIWVRVRRLELEPEVAEEWQDPFSFALSSPVCLGLALGRGLMSSCGSLLGAGFCRVL